MANSLAASDPYTTTFQTTVAERDGRRVVLEETYFYAEGGGQPADRGTIDEVAVADVQATSNGIEHVLESEPSFETGDTIDARIDPEFRTYCMRSHTASHVLYGAGRRLLDDLGYGGFGITDDKVRVDFSTTTQITDDTLVELERLVNQVVWESRSVSWTQHPKQEALSMDEIAFNTKTEEGIAGETVRVVTVEDWDVAACGGTHVSNTREIGAVSVIDRSNPGEGLTRVEIAVGEPGIANRTDEKRALLAAADAAGTAPEELADEIVRLRAERDDLEDRVASLTERVVEARVRELQDETFERDGVTWLAGAVAGLDANALSDQAKELVGESADVVVLASGDGQTAVAVAAVDPVDASQVVDDLTGEFGGGGGGSARFAQGGGMPTNPERVVSHLRD